MAPPLIAPKDQVKPLKANPDEVKPLENIDVQKKWHAMTPDQQKAYLVGLGPEETSQLYDQLGITGKATSISAAPEFTGFQVRKVKGPFGIETTQYAPTPESMEWMRQKAQGFLNWGQENLSNLAGPVGAHIGRAAGAVIGEFIAPEGGGIPGGYTGELVGAGVGGGTGEAIRQGLEHVEGVDKYNEPWENAPGERLDRIYHAGVDQMAAQGFGMLAAGALRPTLKRSINNLYAAGGFDYGDPLAKEATVGTGKSAYRSAGTLEKVINDVMESEKTDAKAGKPAMTLKDLYNNLSDLNDEITKEVDSKMTLPVTPQGVTLRDATPNPTPLVDLIRDFKTADEGVVKRASLQGRDPSVIAAKKYQDAVEQRALTFQQKPWTYGELANERIRINNELNDYYQLTPDGKRVFLNEHPLFEVDKAIADYIRKATYPEMDRLSGQMLGTTAELQGKRGALISLKDQLLKQMSDLATESRQGATKGINASTYATPSGIGWSLHRLPLKFSMNDVEAQANSKVARAFGHTLESKARKATTVPFGSVVLGDNIWSLPARALIYERKDEGGKDYLATRPTPKKPADDDDGGQSSAAPVMSPKELIEKAKRLAPSAQGSTAAYNHTAVNPQTGHKIASPDGKRWFDATTGAQVA